MIDFGNCHEITAAKRLGTQLVKISRRWQKFRVKEIGGVGVAQETGEKEDRPVRELSANAVHLVRTAQLNTLTLSQMADQKANILIGATFVVFSLSVTRLLGSEITLATISLALTAFTSSLFAVLSVLPSTHSVKRTDPHFNKLFFGHFSQVEEEEWIEALLNEFEADETVYRTMLRDIHQNGQVLHRRKYRFLGYAYRIFLAGLLITILVYLGEFVVQMS